MYIGKIILIKRFAVLIAKLRVSESFCFVCLMFFDKLF